MKALPLMQTHSEPTANSDMYKILSAICLQTVMAITPTFDLPWLVRICSISDNCVNELIL